MAARDLSKTEGLQEILKKDMDKASLSVLAMAAFVYGCCVLSEGHRGSSAKASSDGRIEVHGQDPGMKQTFNCDCKGSRPCYSLLQEW